MKKAKKIPKGFSLVELLVSMAIVAILVAISVSGYFLFKQESEIDLGAQKVVNLIRQAQGKSKSMEGDSAWGIEITPRSAIIFRGSDFYSRNTAFDENTKLTGITTATGKTQILFSKLTGLPSVNSVGILTLGNGVTTKKIQINDEGIVSY